MAPASKKKKKRKKTSKAQRPPAQGGPLNPQQRLLVYAYARKPGTTAIEAAIEAGYSKRTAHDTGSRVLNLPDARDLLDRIRSRAEEKAAVSVADVVAELHRILKTDPLDAYNDDGSIKPIKEWPTDLRRALSGLKTRQTHDGRGDDRKEVDIIEVKFWGKTSASDQLMKHLGGYAEDNKQKAESFADMVTAAGEKDE